MDQRKPRKLAAEALWNSALRLLGGRAHSVSELRDKLRRRAERVADVDEVLARLKRAGYLDDRKFAASYAESHLSSQGFGRGRALRDLHAKRVAPAVAEQAVQEAYRDTDEVKLIEGFLERKYRKISLKEYLADPRHLNSAYRKLRLAGFSSTNAIRVLKRYAEQAEALESLDEENR
jgi:SOS response regulatory protein OraA/RecX